MLKQLLECRYHPKCINLTKAQCEKMSNFECPECKAVSVHSSLITCMRTMQGVLLQDATPHCHLQIRMPPCDAVMLSHVQTCYQHASTVLEWKLMHDLQAPTSHKRQRME